MAAKSYEAGYNKHYGDRLKNVSHQTKEEEIQRVYDKWASDYEKEVVLGARYVIYKVLAERLGEAVRQVFPDKPKDELKIIDVGAGTGLVGEELHKLGYSDLHALDISQEMLNEAKKKNVYNKLICASLSDQGIPDVETGEFDALICCGTLLMAHVRPSAFVEMIRMVKIGGLLCFNLRCGESNEYQQKMLELEKSGRWEHVFKTAVPFFESEDMPKETLAFVYKVLSN